MFDRPGAIAVAGLAIMLSPFCASAQAASAWQPPTVMECSLAPGGECNVEAACPADMPFVAAGGGGMPKAEPANHAVAMTMNLPISENKWRVRWRNLSADVTASIKAAVRIKCSDSAAEAGW